MKYHTGVLVATAVILSGCAQIRAVQYAAEYHSVSSDLSEATETPVADVPTQGKATYEGVAVFGMSKTVQAIGLAGDVELEANFRPGGGDLSGSIQKFTGVEIDPGDLIGSASAKIANMATADGEVAITDGVITGNRFSANFDGDLTYDNTDLDLSGTMQGGIFGAQAQLLEAEANAETGSINARFDGAEADAAALYLVARDD